MAAIVLVAAPATAACGDPVDIQVDADACANTLAVSVNGDASGSGGCQVGLVSCVAVSGTGNASNTGGDLSCGQANFGFVGCVAISGTGDATNTAGRGSCGAGGVVVPILYSPFITYLKYPSAGCIAASGTGDAGNTASWASCGQDNIGCVAVSGTGDAENSVAGPPYACVGGNPLSPVCNANGCGSTNGGSHLTLGCFAVSGTGNASNTAGHGTCGYSGNSGSLHGLGVVAAGCVAVSVGGDSTNTVDGPRGGFASCGYNDKVSIAIGCLALSGLGDATNRGSSDWSYGPQSITYGWSPCGQDAPFASTGGVALGCVAVSGGGTASNTVDGQSYAPDLAVSAGSQSLHCLAASPSAVAAPLTGGLTPTTASSWTFDRLAEVASQVPALEPAPWWSAWFAAFQAWVHATFGSVM